MGNWGDVGKLPSQAAKSICLAEAFTGTPQVSRISRPCPDFSDLSL